LASFAKLRSKRCLIPALAFFEFIGTTYPKAKHRFALTDADVMAIAGLWREGRFRWNLGIHRKADVGRGYDE
jgi:putative SOS response-associated peptidase YedK